MQAGGCLVRGRGVGCQIERTVGIPLASLCTDGSKG
jgi:hypothetical protein